MTDKIIRVGMGIVAFAPDGRFLMGQRCNTHGAGTWALPGGTLEFGESFADCAQREMREETGLAIDDVDVLGIVNHVFPAHDKHFVALFCAARIIGDPTPRLMEPDKCAGWHFYADWQNLPQPTFVDYPAQLSHDAIAAYQQKHGLL